jgi:hypothetical protein
MQIKKEVTKPAVPAKTKLQVVAISCDRCGQHGLPDSNHYDAAVAWNEPNQFSVRATTIAKYEGATFPEGGNVSATHWHLCIVCFSDLTNWIREGNPAATPTIEEIST